MAFIKTSGLNDGTKGRRVQIGRIKGLYRIRKLKNRYGYDFQDSFAALHIGKLSVYVQSGLPRRLYNFVR